MFFISKKDVLYTVFIWGTIILGLTMVFPIFSTLTISNSIACVIALIIISWLIWIWFGTGYRVKKNTLRIEAGPLKQTINIQEITKITKEKSVVTAAALAIDRVHIQYGNYKYASISPKQEYEFIQLLISKNPQIQLEDALSVQLTN